MHGSLLPPARLLDIQASWAVLSPRADAWATAFYRRLFAADPAVAALFRYAEPDSQRRKLLDMLGAIVTGMADAPRTIPVLVDLGRRHRDYGVVPAHYPLVGRCLLEAFDEVIAGAADQPTCQRWRAAWDELYGVLATAMLRGAGA